MYLVFNLKMKKNLLITGGNGFFGINLAMQLKNQYNVFLASRNQKRNYEATQKTLCESIPLDVSNINSVRDTFSYVNPEIVIHGAATKFVDICEKFPFECTDINILGSSNLARVAIEKNVKTVIGISTDKATQPIKNFYGFSKATMEKLFLTSNNISKTNFLCVRYGNVVWSTGSVFPIWKKMFEKNKIILTTGPYMRRFFFSIDEAVDLVKFALKNSNKLSGKILGTEMKSSLLINILKVWIKKYGGKYKIVKNRKGDRVDEFLVGSNEIDYTYKIKKNNKIYFVIDLNKKVRNPLKTVISSNNSKKLSKSEISKLISLGMY